MAGRRVFFAVVLIFLSHSITAYDRIPLLISEHHADHMEFFLQNSGDSSAALLVLDAHSDTAANEHRDLIKLLITEKNFFRAGELVGNHNWIHPLILNPVEALVMISATRGSPRADKLEGFLNSTGNWNINIHFDFITVEELRFWEAEQETLFVSIDLDFFYSENYEPNDVPSVLETLFTFSLRWQDSRGQKQGQRSSRVVWAICLSRPWLPDDFYAWSLLDRTFNWLLSRHDFLPPEISLFDTDRYDTSRTAQAIRAQGREVPSLREKDAPDQIKALINELLNRN